MPLDDSDPYWAARLRMSPQQADELRRKAEQAVREGYHAATRAMGRIGETAGRVAAQPAAAVDKFKAGLQAEMNRIAGRQAVAQPAQVAPSPATTVIRPAGPIPSAKREAARRYGAGVLLDRIAEGEGTGGPNGYDIAFGYDRYISPGAKLVSAMTLNELDEFQQEMVRRGSRSTAAGRYQINRQTANELRQRMSLGGSEVFSPELQDRMARERLRMAGYDRFLAGKITAGQLQDKLSGVWTSVARPDGRPRNSRDPVGTDVEEIQRAIDHAKAEADHLIELGDDYETPAWR